jgi:D-sedoheptulose 7-phosphate isomerase
MQATLEKNPLRMRQIEDQLRTYAVEVQTTLSQLPFQEIAKLVIMLSEARSNANTIYLLGNGGSACTASHFACDLSKGTVRPQSPRVRAIALSESVSLITAWANDSSFDQIFAEQLSNVVKFGDIVIGISTSGNSKNVIEAMLAAKSKGANTVGFVGRSGGSLAELVDLCVKVPNHLTQQIEDVHLVIQHMISLCLL